MSIVRSDTRLPIVRKFELSANIPLLRVDGDAGADYMNGVGSNQASDRSNENQMTDNFAMNAASFNRLATAQIAYNKAQAAYDVASESEDSALEKAAWRAYQNAGAALAYEKASRRSYQAAFHGR